MHMQEQSKRNMYLQKDVTMVTVIFTPMLMSETYRKQPRLPYRGCFLFCQQP
jgi:hypothetical protein